MKRLLICLISTLFILSALNSCAKDNEDSAAEWFDVPISDADFYEAAKPLIKKIDTERFSGSNVADDGYYSGYTSLSDNENVIYCEDDGSVIVFFDSSSERGIMRVKKDGAAERLCVVEECRNNPDGRCGHMNYSYGSRCYSNGILYFGISNTVYSQNREGYFVLSSYVLAYDIQTHKVQKLANVDFKDENDDGCAFEYMIGDIVDGHPRFGRINERYGYININGGYLYLTLYSRYLFTKVVRIDLHDNTAAILIDDVISFEKLGYGKLNFYEDNIFSSPKGEIYLWDMDLQEYKHISSSKGGIYVWDMDMASCERLFEYDDSDVIIKQIYDDMIYFLKYPKDAEPGSAPYELFRYDLRTNKAPVLLHDNISDVYIYDDKLYYRLYNGNEIFAAPIVDDDKKYITWDGSYSVYLPENGDALAGSGFYVKNGDIYTEIYTERIERMEGFDEDMVVRYKASVQLKPTANRVNYTLFEERISFFAIHTSETE